MDSIILKLETHLVRGPGQCHKLLGVAPSTYAAYKAGDTEVPLTPTEYRLLEALALRIGKVVPHRVLLSTVWGDEFVDDTHYLRIYVGYLRRKLEDQPAVPHYLINEWGTGYRLAMLPVEAHPSEGPAATLEGAPEPLRRAG